MKPDQLSQIAKEYEQQSLGVLVCDGDGHVLHQSKSIPNPSAPFLVSIMHSANALLKNSSSLTVSVYGDQAVHISRKDGYIFAVYEK